MKRLMKITTTLLFTGLAFTAYANPSDENPVLQENEIIQDSSGSEGSVADPAEITAPDLMDPVKSGTIKTPEKWKETRIYLGATYYGANGCRAIANYYGYSQVSTLGPYVLPATWMPGYWTYYGWVPGYWLPAYSVSYCYGVVKFLK